MTEPTVPPTEQERQASAAAAAQASREKFADSVSDATAAPPNEVVEHARPDHVPEKYWNKETGAVNYEAWNKAHTALETQFHQSTSKEGDTTPAEEGDSDDKPETGGDTDEAVQALVETPAAVKAAENYAASGKLEESDYDALAANGIPREMVDTYIAGQEAKAAAINNAAYEPCGGEENYSTLLAWAAKLPSGEKKAFNTQIGTGDPEVIRAAVSSLYSKFSETANIEADRLGGTPPSTSSSTFESRSEMTQAINKVNPDTGKRFYDTDPAYRAEIQRKIGNSRNAGKVF